MTHTHIPRLGDRAPRRRRPARYAALSVAGALVALSACKDSVVPFFTAPTSIPTNQSGLKQAIMGLFSYTRNDQFQVVLELSSYAREDANFTNTEPRFIEYDLGIIPIPVGAWIETWANEYQDIREAQQILAAIPKVTPAYTPQQAAGLRGVVQTMEALNYLIIAWAHDSEGLAILQSPTATTTAPAYCLQDGLKYIVALLDTANANLDSAGSTPFPFKLPPGFAAVGAFAGPSTAAGSFASFNRALAAKAGLELAYAIAHQKGGAAAPTVTSPGAPDVAALTRADSAAKASALFVPTSLPTNPVGQWSYDNFSVLYDFSAQSGDVPNPMNGIIGTQAVLNEVVANQDTAHDLRWKAKFLPNPAGQVQQQSYNFVASLFIYGMYPSPASPIPIIRSETLTLVEAQIRLGLGDLAGALGLINDVRTEVGGLAPTSGVTYPAVRDALLKEQQISTMMEGGADRVIALRMYSLEVADDTTWNGTKYGPDQHTTVSPMSSAELTGRGGSFTTTCP